MTDAKHDNKVRRNYDQIATRYDEWLGHRQRAQFDAIRQHLPSPPPSPILDLGAGTGMISKYLKLKTVSVDISRGMLSQGFGQRCQANWRQLPFRTGVFSTVLSVSSLETSTDPHLKLTEMKRVLKTGGYFYLTVLKTEDLRLVESRLERLNFANVQQTDALDAILYWGLKSSGSEA